MEGAGKKSIAMKLDDHRGGQALQRQLDDRRCDRMVSGAGSVLQLDSKVKNTSQTVTWPEKNSFTYGLKNSQSTRVGHVMKAYLDPNDPIRGQSASLNTDQNKMMWYIKARNGLANTHAVKGHLLNDNLGGNALNANLFPLTKAANAVHLGTAENHVKNRLWNDGLGTYYEVRAVKGTSQFNDHFDYTIKNWDPDSGAVGGAVASGTIESDLLDATNMKKANPLGAEYIAAKMTAEDAEGAMKAFSPQQNVGDLSESEQTRRDRSGRIDTIDTTSTGSKYTF